jgi:hypothetical protein
VTVPLSGVMVKERIYKYLLEAGRGVEASQILRDVLGIYSPNAHSSESVLAGFLEQDPRFLSAGGCWHIHHLPKAPSGVEFGNSVVLHVQSPDSSGILQGVRGAIGWAGGRCQEFAAPASINILSRIRSEIGNHLLIVWSRRELRLWNGLLRSKRQEAWQGNTLYLRDLAARVLKRMPSKLQPEDLASALGLSPPDGERPLSLIRYLNECWSLLLERIPAEFCRDLDLLLEWMHGRQVAVDFSRFSFGPDFLRQLPSASGVYMMMNSRGKILYVGKSRNLKRRVSSYFTPRALSQPKIAKMHAHLHSLEILRTDNEVEALLMEMRMIKDFRPPINLQTEVHDRQDARHEGRNLLLFVADAEQKGANIYFFHNGIFSGRHSAPLGRPPTKRLRAKVETLFFTQGRSRKQRGEVWEKEIVSRWLTANQRRLNYLDVDEAGDLAAVMARLQQYLNDPDRLAHKVYYR